MELLDITHPNENHFRITKLSAAAKEALKTWPNKPIGEQAVKNYIELVDAICEENNYRMQKIDIPHGLYMWQLKEMLKQKVL
jgi:hypothetical protein